MLGQRHCLNVQCLDDWTRDGFLCTPISSMEVRIIGADPGLVPIDSDRFAKSAQLSESEILRPPGRFQRVLSGSLIKAGRM